VVQRQPAAAAAGCGCDPGRIRGRRTPCRPARPARLLQPHSLQHPSPALACQHWRTIRHTAPRVQIKYSLTPPQSFPQAPAQRQRNWLCRSQRISATCTNDAENRPTGMIGTVNIMLPTLQRHTGAKDFPSDLRPCRCCWHASAQLRNTIAATCVCCCSSREPRHVLGAAAAWHTHVTRALRKRYPHRHHPHACCARRSTRARHGHTARRTNPHIHLHPAFAIRDPLEGDKAGRERQPRPPATQQQRAHSLRSEGDTPCQSAGEVPGASGEQGGQARFRPRCRR
jgi:hypothetical protein